MQLNSFVLRLSLLLLPGLLGSKIYRKLRGKTEKQSWEDFAEILLFSITSYLFYFALVGVFHFAHSKLADDKSTPKAPSSLPTSQQAAPTPSSTTQSSPFQPFIDDTSPLDWKGITAASVLSVVVAFVTSAIATRQVVNKICYWAGATGRQGDACVWSLFNQNYAPPTEYQWAFVRDLKSNVVYFGQIRFYSDPGEFHELVLNDVTVYKNDDGERLYESRVLYVARSAGELSIEFPALVVDNRLSSTQGLSHGETDSSTNTSDQPTPTC